MTRPAREWLQLNAALTRRDGSALPSARGFIRDIEAAVLTKGRRGSTRFFFQRKSPDLRLRFYGEREALMRRLRPVISRARSNGHIAKSFYSVYEPEQRQFGGRECMEHVHGYWATDSLIWIALDRLIEVDRFRLPYQALMVSALDDLFCGALNDDAEIWDAWCNLGMLLQHEPSSSPRSIPAFSLDALKDRSDDEERRIILQYQKANARLAAGLLEVWQQGKMRYGIRSILPYVALFTLNRHGFGRPEIAAIIDLVTAARDPKRHLIGAAP